MNSRKHPYVARIEQTLLLLAFLAVTCGQTIACSSPSTSFPIYEDFESNSFAFWTQDSADDFNWVTRTGSTPSGGTGPTGAYDGSYYAYTEATSPNNPNKVANLISPCFTVQNGVSTNLEFAYHMLGSGMGTFNLDITTNDGGSWTNLWTLSGNQGSNWQTHTINLDAYAGQDVKLRFNVITGNYQSDVSIDNVSISTAVPAEICDDGIDNDGDGFTDCEDNDCGQITNNQFDSGTSGWNHYNFLGNSSTFTIDGTSELSGVNSARVDITNVGSQSWYTQLEHNGLSLENGKTYLIVFKARSTVSRNIQVMVQETFIPFTTYFVQDVQTAAFDGTYAFEFTATSDESFIDLTFNLGQELGTVWIDDVQFKEICPTPECILPTDEFYDVCAEDFVSGSVASNDVVQDETFQITYQVTGPPTKGDVVFYENGDFTYTANPGESGSDSFTYERCYKFKNTQGLSNVIFNPCGDGLIIESFIEGIEGESSPSIQITNPTDMTRVFVEVWAETACGSVTIEGVTATEYNLYRTDGTVDSEKLYRVELTSVSGDGLIDISKSGGCVLSSAAAYVERVQPGGQGSSTLIASDIDLYHGYFSGDDCFVYDIPLGESGTARDITFTIPLHEKDNVREVTASVIAGSVTGSATTTTWNGIGQGVGEIVITLNDVPGYISTATLDVCSPDGNGDSFGVGIISATTLVCTEEPTFDCCSEATATFKINSASILNSSPGNCFGNGLSTLTAVDSEPGLNPTYEWGHTAETAAEIIVAPTETTTYYVTITNDLGCENTAQTTVTVFPEMDLDISYSGTLCLEDDTQLTANVSGGSPGYSYAWTGPNSFTGNTAAIDVSESGNYYVTVTDSEGCSAELSAFVYEAYSPFIFTLNTEVCEGEDVTLSVNSSSAVQFNWGANAGNANTSSVTVTPSPPSTEYFVTVTNDLGCVTSASAVIDVISRPTVNVTGPSDLCEGETSSLSPTSGGTWVSSNSAVAVVDDSGVVTAMGAGTATFIFTNSSTLCESLPTASITVEDRPIVSVTGPTSICEGFTSQLSPTTGGFWTSADESIATVDNSGVVTGIAAGTTTFTFTNTGTGCVSDATEQITVQEEPTVSITGANTICIGATTTLTPTSGGIWTSSDNSVAVISNGGVVTALAEGQATFTFTTNQGCVSSPSATVTVDPEGSATITGESLLCEDASTTMTVSSLGGEWVSSNPSIATINSSGVVTALATGMITITYEYPDGSCIQDPMKVINIIGKPTVSISGSTSVCVGENTQLATSGSGGFWTSSDSDIAVVSSTGTVVGVSAGTVTFTYTSSNGCESDATGNITVDPGVEVDIDFNGSLCLTDDSQLSAIVTGGTANYTYSWTGPGGFNANTQTVNILLNGNYNLTVTDSKGCSSNTTAFVYEAYEPFIFALNTDVCEGKDVTLSVNSSSPATYQWGPNASNATSQSVTVSPGVPSTSYSVTVTNSLGCTTEATAVIDVDPKPTVGITGPNSICVNGTSQLSPSSGGTWTSSNFGVATVSSSGEVTGLGEGSATFTFRSDATGCFSDPTAEITVSSNGTITISGENQICLGDSPTLAASVSGGSWSSSDVGIAQINSSGVVTPNSQGIVTITYTPNSSECYSNATYELTIHELPSLGVNGPSTICENDQTFLSSSTSGAWTSSDPMIANVSPSGIVTGINAGVVTFSFVSNAGCPQTLGTPITIIGNPEVSLDGPGDICVNSTTNLLPNSGGIWMSSNTNVAIVNSNGEVTGISEGMALFTFIEFTNGCISDDMIAVNVNDKPNINGLDNNELCIGETTNITPSNGGVWSSSNESVATISNTGEITAVGAGTATFTYTNSLTGCTSNASAPLTVNDEPTINFTGPTSICVGENTSISPSVGGVWGSTDVSVATIAADGTITGVAPGSVQFIYTSNATGCSSSASEVLTVENPTEIQITGPSNICIGESTSLTPGTGGVWESSDENIAVITNGGFVTGISPGDVTFIFNSNTGCASESSATITIDPDPTVEVSGPSSICIGTTTNLSPSLGGGWTSSNPTIASVDQNGLVTGLSEGSVTFTFVSDATGCSATTSSSVSVFSNPEVTIAGDDEICIGETTNMLPSTGGSWVSNHPSIATISSSGVVTGMNAGTATFTFYESGTGCVSDVSAPITILPKPNIVITGSNIICVGETTTLSPTLGGIWLSSDESVATITNQGVVTGHAQGLARFTFISEEGCSSDESAPVIVFGKPTAVLSESDLLCTNETGQMLPSSGGNWTSSDPSVATIEDDGVFTAVSPGTVTFVFTDSNTGCISDESETITVNEGPEISVLGPTDICIGGNTNLVPSSGGIWTSIDPGVAIIQNNGEVLGISAGQARFIFTSLSSGCVSDTSSYITVNSGPQINFTGPQSVCIGETTSINPLSNGTWISTDEAIATIDNSGLITAVGQGSVKFRYTETATGCQSELSEALIVNGPPTVFVNGPDEICLGGFTTLTPSTGGAWISLQPEIATVDAAGNVTAVSSGVAYFVFTDDATGCESDGNLSITVRDDVSIGISGDADICLGYTTTLFPSSGGFWTSSNPAVASVSNSGVVRALAPGVVTFEFTDGETGCVVSSPTDPVIVRLCTNHDFNVTMVDQEITGNLATNDNVPVGTTYSNSTVLVEKPPLSLPALTVNTDGTYSFTADVEGKYIFDVPVCIPPTVFGCPTTLLEITVIDGIYSGANPVSNLEFATTFSDADPLQNGQPVDIDPLLNDDCVYTSGCTLVGSSVIVHGGAGKGTTTVSSSGVITYTPSAGTIGKDTIFYTVCAQDEPTNCSQSFQVITINDVTALNSTVAVDDFGYMLKATPLSGNVRNNDSDPEGDAINVVPQGSLLSPITIPEGEYYIEANGDYTFTPNPDYSGGLEIVYTLCDDAVESVCTDATLHLLVFDDVSLSIRMYLEGALIENGGEFSIISGRPLMRDDLRVSPFTGENYIPLSDPYTISHDVYMDTPSRFLKMGPGMMPENLTITDSLSVFSVEGDDAIVDWVHVELRSKDDYEVAIATRSGLLQRDGDVVDLDGESNLRFNGINVDSVYVVVKHRSHLGVMSELVSFEDLVDFTSPDTPVFNYGLGKDGVNDYTGLSLKSGVVDDYLALWAGDFDSNGRVKFTNPADDVNILFINVLFSSPEFLINYDNAIGYFTGDYNMNSKSKYTNPQDDINYLFSQILLYPLNTSFLSNFNGLIEQVPPRN